MRKSILPLTSVATLALLSAGCGNKAVQAGSGGQTPEDLLKWSMDQYHHAKSFSTTIDFHIKSEGFGMKGERTRLVSYQSPNLYRVVATLLPSKITITCVSDGTTETDYSDNNKATAMATSAPTAFHEISSSPMIDPTVCGSPLYYFFGGSENIGLLEKQGDEKATWGPDGSAPSGEATKTVRFMAAGSVFGHTEATIGVKTGLVYKIVWDSQPIVDQKLNGHTRQDAIDALKKALETLPKGAKRDSVQKAITEGPSIFDIDCSETYANSTFDPAIELATFKPHVPAGEKFAPPPPDGKPPVAIGKPVPDLSFKDASGNSVSLSSLRGHVVLLEFWASSSKQCMQALPVTSALADKYAGQGLKVIDLTADAPATVSAFTKQLSFKLPAYTDPLQKGIYAYHVAILPTTVVIDAKGNLSDYIPGLAEPADIQASLARAGIKI